MCFHDTSVYIMYIPCIYQTYTCIYNWYRMYLLFSGFCGSYRPSAPPIHLEDNVPDDHDEFWYPRYKEVLETFITHMSKLADVEYQVQGPGELRCKDRVSYRCHIISIYLLYALHIPCIYHVYQINLNCTYAKYISSIFYVYALHIPCIYF